MERYRPLISCTTIILLCIGFYPFLSCKNIGNGRISASKTITDSSAISVTEISETPVDSINSSATIYSKVEAKNNDSNRVLIRAYDDIMFGTQCYSSERYPGLTDLPFGSYKISGINFSYVTNGCSEKYGLYSFTLTQNEFTFSDLTEMYRRLNDIIKIISYKYNEPKPIKVSFGIGGLPKNFLHIALSGGEELNDTPPSDDFRGTFIKQWDHNSITIQIGYYKDYTDMPITVNDGYYPINHIRKTRIIGYNYKAAYRIAINFTSNTVQNLLTSDKLKEDDSSNRVDRSKF